MIHFNALDFNVCRSEELISFFWRSVYMQIDLKFYKNMLLEWHWMRMFYTPSSELLSVLIYYRFKTV